jgi:hypothetical protein
VLGIDDLTAVLEATPPLDHTTALMEATEWLGERDPSEHAPRETPLHFTPAPS